MLLIYFTEDNSHFRVVFFKLVGGEDFGDDEHRLCPEGNCAEMRLTFTAGDLSDSNCVQGFLASDGYTYDILVSRHV